MTREYEKKDERTKRYERYALEEISFGLVGWASRDFLRTLKRSFSISNKIIGKECKNFALFV